MLDLWCLRFRLREARFVRCVGARSQAAAGHRNGGQQQHWTGPVVANRQHDRTPENAFGIEALVPGASLYGKLISKLVSPLRRSSVNESLLIWLPSSKTKPPRASGGTSSTDNLKSTKELRSSSVVAITITSMLPIRS